MACGATEGQKRLWSQLGDALVLPAGKEALPAVSGPLQSPQFMRLCTQVTAKPPSAILAKWVLSRLQAMGPTHRQISQRLQWRLYAT